MPIFSAVKTSLGPNSLFKPATLINADKAPKYAFHFTTKTDATDFTFDDCRDYEKNSIQMVSSWTNPADQTMQTLNLNEHHLHYERLFLLTYLKKVDGHQRYYLIPRLIIPYEKSGADFVATITTLFLKVRGFSIYEPWLSRYVRKQIQNGGATRYLKLTPSEPDVIEAKWTNPSGASDQITEDKLLKNLLQRIIRDDGEEVKVTIKPSSTPFKSHQHIDITDPSGTTIFGRVSLNFVPKLSRKVLFFEVEKPPDFETATSAITSLKVRMIAAGTSPSDAAPIHNDDLEYLYKKTGVAFEWIDRSLEYNDGTSNSNKSIDKDHPTDIIDINKDFRAKNPLRDDELLDTVYKKFVNRVKYDANTKREYIFVFFAIWAVSKISTTLTSGNVTTTLTEWDKGISNRLCSCIFDYSRHTLCHEVMHAIGCRHVFLRTSDTVTTKIAANDFVTEEMLVRAQLKKIDSVEKYYDLHDTMNSENAPEVMDGVYRIENKISATTLDFWVQNNFYKVYCDYYFQKTTRNMLDYGEKAEIDNLAKHQVEFARFFLEQELL
jgi:hypothetical protein